MVAIQKSQMIRSGQFRPVVGAVCTWNLDAPHLSVYSKTGYGIVLGNASPLPQVIKRGQKNCSKVMIAPVSLEEKNNSGNPWTVKIDQRIAYVDLDRISHVEMYRLDERLEGVQLENFSELRKSAVKKIRKIFSSVKKPYWKALLFPDQHSGHNRPVLVVGEDFDNDRLIAMLDSRHCPKNYQEFNGSYVSSNGIYGPQIRFMIPELVTFPRRIAGCTKNLFDKKLLVPDDSVIDELKSHILLKQLTFSR